MPELSHVFGSDLTLDPTGDLALVDGSQEGQQRVLRRLMTNAGAYLWNLDYGAGLARFLGMPTAAAQIAAVSRRQMFLEPAVARQPAPVITVQASVGGTVVETIKYVDAVTATPIVLSVPVGS